MRFRGAENIIIEFFRADLRGNVFVSKLNFRLFPRVDWNTHYKNRYAIKKLDKIIQKLSFQQFDNFVSFFISAF